ncbi:hypothetical protein [Glutamicibacter sp. TV12E]|uniref:hypothetical protein n=1 Tax=Glutamicibacter sp. TV12E TaxID=3446362 RepID=UPI00403450CA
MKNKWLKISVLSVVAIGIIFWIFRGIAWGPMTAQESEFEPSDISSAIEDLGYSVSVPKYSPQGYHLSQILVTHLPPVKDNNPKELTLVYERQGYDTFEVVARKMQVSFAEEVTRQKYPTDVQSWIKIHESEAAILQTKAKDSPSLRMLYAPSMDRSYEVRTENRTGRSLGEADMREILESIK